MRRQEPNDEILELAALYALGALDGEERERFEKRVAEGCATCRAVEEFQQVANRLGTSVKPIKPRSELREKLFERVRAEPQFPISDQSPEPAKHQPPPAGFTFVPHGEGDWQEAGPGMWLKILYSEAETDRMTALVRMNPGCNYASHRHARSEELYVLEGTCFCGGRLLHPGDYHRAEPGSIHYETSTEDGCVMLVIFSPNNEMLDPAPANS